MKFRLSLLPAFLLAVFVVTAAAAPQKNADEAVNKALKAADKSAVAAIPLLEQAEKEYPFHNANLEILYQLAMAYVDAGRYEDANKTLDKLVARYGKYSDTLVRVDEGKVAKSHVLRAQGKYDEAMDFVKKFIRENPKSPALNSARLELANLQVKKGQYDEAAKNVAPFVKSPTHELFLPASYVLAEISVRQGKPDEAEKRMLAILKTNNNKDVRSTTFYKLGEIYRGCSNFVGAISVYRRIKTPGRTKEDRASNAGILWEIAQTYEQLGHFTEARIGFEGIMRLYPEVEFSTQAWHRAVQSDISAGNFARAEKSYLDFIKEHPGSPDAANLRLAIAQALIETNQYAEAVRQLRAGLEEYKEGEPAENMYFTLGSALLSEGKYAEAEETLKNFAEKFPQSTLVPQSYVRLTEGFIEQKRFKEAEEFLGKTIDKFPDFAAEHKLADYQEEIKLARAGQEAEKGNYKEAVLLCDEITLERLREQANYLKADMLVKQGEIEEAAELLNSMVNEATDPELKADITATLGGVYMRTQDYAKAEETFDKILSMDLAEDSHAKPVATLQKAFCRNFANDTEGTKAFLEQVLKDYPKADECGDALYWLAYFEKNARKNLEAGKLYERIVKEYPENSYAPEAAYESAECLVSANKYVESIEAFKKAYESFPETGFGALALVRVGEVLASQNYELKSWKEELVTFKSAASRIALLSLPVRAGDVEGTKEALGKLDSAKMNEAQMGYALAFQAAAENLFGDYKKAAESADAALTLTRECGENVQEALFQRAEAAYLSGDKSGSIPYFDELLENYVIPNPALQITACLNRAHCALEARDAATADSCCQQALGQRPNAKQSAEAVLMRAQACEITGSLKQAAQFYKRVTVLYGKMPEFAVPAYKGLITAYKKLGLTEELNKEQEQFKLRYPNEAK